MNWRAMSKSSISNISIIPKRLLYLLLIIVLLMPSSLFSNQKIIYYEKKIQNDSIYEETLLFYGQNAKFIQKYLHDYDSMFINLEKINDKKTIVYYEDSLYQLNGFGRITNSEILSQLNNMDDSIMRERRQGKYSNKEVSQFSPKIFNSIDKTIIAITLSSILSMSIIPFFITSDRLEAFQASISYTLLSCIFFVPLFVIQYSVSYINSLLISLFK